MSVRVQNSMGHMPEIHSSRLKCRKEIEGTAHRIHTQSNIENNSIQMRMTTIYILKTTKVNLSFGILEDNVFGILHDSYVVIHLRFLPEI